MKLVAGKLIVNAWNATFATLSVFAKLVGDVILTAGKQGRVGLWLMTQIMTHSIFKGGAEMSEFAMKSAKVLAEIKVDVHENIDKYYRNIMIAGSLWEQKNALGELQLYMKRQIKKIKEVESVRE